MCGRFGFSIPKPRAEEVFGLDSCVDYAPEHNIFPGADGPVIARDAEGERALALLRWGLVPFWADDPKIGNRMINARSETAPSKPAFRAAFKKRRCIVPADRFYEWKQLEKGRGKQPYAITMADGKPFGMAGLWEHWSSEEGSDLYTFTILTGEPNELVAPIHDRMPVILEPEGYARWLDPETDPKEAAGLLSVFPAARMAAEPVERKTLAPLDGPPSTAQAE